jgi:hypothetical protein
MQNFEQQLQQRFPHLFRGRRATLARPLLRAIGRWSRFDAIAGHLAANGHLRDFDFVRSSLEFLQARYVVDAAELRRIPASGRLLIVANHPSGALDALALLDAIGQVRRDVKIVANDLLSSLAPLSGLLLPIRIVGGRPGAGSLGAIEQALREDLLRDRLPGWRSRAAAPARSQRRALAARLPALRARHRYPGVAGAHRGAQFRAVLRRVGAVQAGGHGAAGAGDVRASRTPYRAAHRPSAAAAGRWQADSIAAQVRRRAALDRHPARAPGPRRAPSR